jgi:H/ACA ribonucleoprotein complex subunit 4
LRLLLSRLWWRRRRNRKKKDNEDGEGRKRKLDESTDSPVPVSSKKAKVAEVQGVEKASVKKKRKMMWNVEKKTKKEGQRG